MFHYTLYNKIEKTGMKIVQYKEKCRGYMVKRTAIVTGASRGIGYAIAKRLGQDGFNVILAATGDITAYRERFTHLSEKGISWEYVQADIKNASDREKLLDSALCRFGRVDVLVNNAGVAPKERRDLLDMTEESFDRVVGINTKGTLFLTQAVARQMINQPILSGAKKKGTIINVSSVSSTASSVNRGEYCISKAGVSMLTTLFADRLASEGIVVNEVRPGVIATDMTSSVKAKYNKLLEEGVFPIARWGTPEDVAEVVACFCRDDFCYTTGNYVDVDGGFHILRL